MKMHILAAVFAGSTLVAPAALANPYPIVFISKHHVMTGQNDLGRFTVSDGRVSCSAHYDADTTVSPMTTRLSCSDGRKGVTHSVRPFDPDEYVDYSSGSGTFRLSDGTKGVFYWGDAAGPYLR